MKIFVIFSVYNIDIQYFEFLCEIFLHGTAHPDEQTLARSQFTKTAAR